MCVEMIMINVNMNFTMKGLKNFKKGDMIEDEKIFQCLPCELIDNILFSMKLETHSLCKGFVQCNKKWLPYLQRESSL